MAPHVLKEPLQAFAQILMVSCVARRGRGRPRIRVHPEAYHTRSNPTSSKNPHADLICPQSLAQRVQVTPILVTDVAQHSSRLYVTAAGFVQRKFRTAHASMKQELRWCLAILYQRAVRKIPPPPLSDPQTDWCDVGTDLLRRKTEGHRETERNNAAIQKGGALRHSEREANGHSNSIDWELLIVEIFAGSGVGSRMVRAET